jgi:quercetin dioxygenase-like cupin family protein
VNISADNGGLVDWAAVAESEPYADVRARRFDTGQATVVRYEFGPDAVYPWHEHGEEQLVHVLSGAIELELGATTLSLTAGDLVHVPGGVPHGARAREAGAIFLNVVVPRRR